MFAMGKGTPIDVQNIINCHFKLMLKRGAPLHSLARSQAYLRDPATVQGHAPDLRAEVFGTRVRAVNPRQVLSLDALYGPQHRRRDRRGSRLEHLEGLP